jgi:hypothetical protein
MDIAMSMGHYLRSLSKLANQFTPNKYRDAKCQRLYLKDIDTPEDWARSLKEFIPETFYYLNECIESRTGGDGAILEPNEYGQMSYGKGVAPAGDLMSSLPPEMRAENMMCYIGHEGTYTPAHREMCASLGHNIMVEASQDDNGEKAGSSVWFMTETKEREVVSEYFLSMLGHDIEVEKHFAQINAWKKAPFNVWVVEQKPGDLILIPPLAPHQVWNRGTRTMKAAWNRTTVDTLELALHEALPRARLVCRDEQYKNKAIIYYTLINYYQLLQRDTVEPKMWKHGRIKQLLEDFKRLFALYAEVLVSEMFSPQLPPEVEVELLPYDSNVTCSYCRCNIFNRFLTCKSCIEYGENGVEDTYDICMECYAMGRSCACISNLKWVQQWEWSTLTQNYEQWREMLVQCEGSFDTQKPPQPLDTARKRFGRKPVAQVCQEQLKIRPWCDPLNDPTEWPSSEEEPEVDDNGSLKKKPHTKGRKAKALRGKSSPCHVCYHQELNWKLASCTTCKAHYCYGVLWRAFDLMPQDVMEDRDWSCPKCQNICSCARCRKNPKQNGYAPKGTLLGHDTKKVADFRSVESLVDFSKTNLWWLRGENDDNPQESARMKKLKERAEIEKARDDVIGQNYLDEREQTPANDPIEDNGHYDEDMSAIDPRLLTLPASSISRANGNYNYLSAADRSVINGHDYLAEYNQWLGNNALESESAPSKTNYPDKLLAPAAPNITSEGPPMQFAQNRMMGIGYYQQGSGVDQILYDPPQTTPGSGQASPNFALSDLAPNPEENKKRKHHNSLEDEEYYTSKRQKQLKESKNRAGHLSDHDEDFSSIPMYAIRQPRRSVGKPQTYTDLGEESMPFTEDDIVATSAQKGDREAGAKSRFTRKPTSEKEKSTFVNKRRSVQQTSKSGTPAAVLFPKKERKSAWLARKEAAEKGEEYVPEVDQDSREQNKPDTPIINISSGSEAERDDSNDDDSLFFDESRNGSDRSAAETIERHISNVNSEVQVATPKSTTSKRRGRPPKVAKSTSIPPNTIILKPSEREEREGIYENETLAPAMSFKPKGRSSEIKNTIDYEDDEDKIPAVSAHKRRDRPSKTSSAVSTAAGSNRMLSLQQKLALKGKSVKIVSGKLHASLGSAVTSLRSPSVAQSSRTASASKDDMRIAVEVPAAVPKATPVQKVSFESHEVFDADGVPESNEGLDSALKFLEGGSLVVENDITETALDSPSPALSVANGFTTERAEISVPSPSTKHIFPTRHTVVHSGDRMSITSPSPSRSRFIKKGLTIIRKDEESMGYPIPPPTRQNPPAMQSTDKLALLSPSPPLGPQVKKRSTVIRKSDDFLMSSPPKPASKPVRKGPTVVRLSGDDEPDYSSNDSSSDDSIPAVRIVNPSSRGYSNGKRGMFARRGRGQPPAGRP